MHTLNVQEMQRVRSHVSHQSKQSNLILNTSANKGNRPEFNASRVQFYAHVTYRRNQEGET